MHREDLRCGWNFPLSNGLPAQCNPKDVNGDTCCSEGGWCGNTSAHCECEKWGDCRTTFYPPPYMGVTKLFDPHL